jgi:hypothetical protein
MRAARLTDVVDAADVGMFERRNRPRLALEAGPRRRIIGDLGREESAKRPLSTL